MSDGTWQRRPTGPKQPATRPGERIQKLLAQAGIASRREAEEMIRDRRVTINGQTAELGDKADLTVDAVKVDGKRVASRDKPQHYLLLNKPKGVLSTRHDPVGRPTVMDLVPAGMRSHVVPVGRLDFDTEGLLLLTDDGDLAYRLTHPRFGGRKTYEVKVKGTPDEAGIAKLRRGIVLEGKRTAPAEIELLRAAKSREVDKREAGAENNSWWEVVLTEGRSRQIREMFFRIGHPVQKLRRVAIGPLRDPQMPLGTWRELNEREVAALIRSVAREKPAAAPPPRAVRRVAPVTPADPSAEGPATVRRARTTTKSSVPAGNAKPAVRSARATRRPAESSKPARQARRSDGLGTAKGREAADRKPGAAARRPSRPRIPGGAVGVAAAPRRRPATTAAPGERPATGRPRSPSTTARPRTPSGRAVAARRPTAATTATTRKTTRKPPSADGPASGPPRRPGGASASRRSGRSDDAPSRPTKPRGPRR